MFLAVARQGGFMGAPWSVLAANAAVPRLVLIRQACGLQNLGFFAPDRFRIEATRSFHGCDREHLGQVVLHHVPERTGGFVVTSAFLHADCFCRSDLNAGDVVPVPDRFENGVGEPQNHDVLNGFLAEIVVDAEDLVFLSAALNHAIERLSTAVIPTEWLFDHHAAALGVFE